jgi:hypothetical protein
MGILVNQEWISWDDFEAFYSTHKNGFQATPINSHPDPEIKHHIHPKMYLAALW